MSKSWPTQAIGELCSLINGRAFKPSDWGKDGLPIVRIQNLNDPLKPFNFYSGKVSSNHLIDSGEILLSWSGTPGTSFGCFRWSRGPAVLNQHIFKVVVDESIIDGDFFIYGINSRLDEMISHAHGGVGLRHITKGKLEGIHLPIPPLSEQRRIVARIKECMERVEEIERLSAEAIKESHALNDAVFADFVESLPKDDLSIATLNDVISECKYGSSTKASLDGTGTPILRMGNIQESKLDVSDLKFVKLPQKECAKYLLREGDILINRTNSLELVGKSGLFKGLAGNWVYASYLIRLRVDCSKALPEFINAVINSRIGRSYILRTARRAIGMVNINAEEIKRMPIPLPPISVQEELVAKMSAAEPLVSSIRHEVQEATSTFLRDAILRKAFAGEL
jgi:type I restriction enzyme S subunit